MRKSVAVSRKVWRHLVSLNVQSFRLLICALSVVDPSLCGQVILFDSSLLQYGVQELPLFVSESE